MSTFDWLSDLGPERVRPLKRVEFERLISEGLLDDEHIELLGGAIVEMTPQDPRHAATVTRLAEVLARVAGTDKLIRAQAPFAASDNSLPEPDIAVVARSDYDDAHPSAAFLIVEVSNSSLHKDRSFKSDVYACAAVPEYWIVNLAEHQIEVRTMPSDGHYTKTVVARSGDSVRVAYLGNAEVTVSGILR